MKLRLTEIYIILFIIVAYILLPIMNSDYLYTIEENNLYVGSKTIMNDLINGNGGLWSLASCYLTQFLYFPWIGSSILIFMWVAMYYMGVLTTSRIHPDLSGKWHFVFLVPLFTLLYEILSYGYHLYYTKNIGFPFKLTILFFIIWLSVCLLCQVITIKKANYKTIMVMSLLCLTPVVTLLCIDAPKGFKTTFYDTNFRKELKMYRAIDKGQWDDVLSEAPLISHKDSQRPTNLMVLYKNIALLHKGEVLSSMYKYDSRGIVPTQKGMSKISISRIAAPMLYYQLGQINYSYRWAMENSVKYHISFDNLKMMIRCCMFNREFEVAQKYISILKSSFFHKKWAKQYETMLHDNGIFMNSDEFKSIFSMTIPENELESDDADIEGFIYGYFSNYISKNPRIEELSILSSLQTKSVEEYMIHFYHYTLNHPDETIPTIMQEAAYLFGPFESNPIDVSRFPFDISVTERFQQFCMGMEEYQNKGMQNEVIAQNMRPMFGDTYWWFYYFYNNHKTY